MFTQGNLILAGSIRRNKRTVKTYDHAKQESQSELIVSDDTEMQYMYE